MSNVRRCCSSFRSCDPCYRPPSTLCHLKTSIQSSSRSQACIWCTKSLCVIWSRHWLTSRLLAVISSLDQRFTNLWVYY